MSNQSGPLQIGERFPHDKAGGQRMVGCIQLARWAIRIESEVSLARHNLSKEDIDEVILALAFGTYLDVHSAITIGLLP
jgi:uncharacterized 2Fe-2S/4Fe-4S cluster protein (DUF4445 family)